jgi:biotin carboxyl carrier protein
LLPFCSAEVLDKHLSMVQRDHEQKSQIVERRIRDDAALEEAKRKEQAMKDEKIRQERAKQEAEARQKAAAKLAVEAQKAAAEAAAKEAAEAQKAAAEVSKSSQNSQNNVAGTMRANKSEIKSELPGISCFYRTIISLYRNVLWSYSEDLLIDMLSRIRLCLYTYFLKTSFHTKSGSHYHSLMLMNIKWWILI